MPLKLLRLARTLWPLKSVQFRARARGLFYTPRLKSLAAPSLREQTGDWVQPIAHPSTLIGPTCFRFLNQEGAVDTTAQWNDDARDKLWLYNLHYFGDLNAAGWASRTQWHRALINRWVADNPATFGIGWEPYPTSLRIVNWIKYFLAGNPPEPHWLESLAAQSQWLSQRLEFHLLGNHLLVNAKALVYAGLYFQCPAAESWLARGLAICREQREEQILADGGHFERSPMYHALVLEDFLDLLNVARNSSQQLHSDILDWSGTALRMQEWLTSMCHPDGDIAFFNDAAFGVAANTEALNAYAVRLRLPGYQIQPKRLLVLAASGYLRMTSGEAVTLIDAAPIGPDYIPGHAHADTLSFETSLGTERIIVNGGTSVYGNGPQRLLERSTAAHSTVEVGGHNSSEVWAAFRVGRRARIINLATDTNDEAVLASATHDGYRWLRGRPLHSRTWIQGKNRLVVKDNVSGGDASAIAYFHLGVGVCARAEPNRRHGTLVTPKGQTVHWRTSGPADVVASQWHPEFGRTITTQALRVPLDNGALAFELSW